MNASAPFRTKADVAYAHMRELVLEGRVAPGERVRISHVARDLGMSDIPVREAVARLEAEGLLLGEPHKGAVVAALGAHEIEELFAIRTELEALAIRRAARELTEPQLEELSGLVAQMQAAEREGRASDYGRLNRAFHFAMYGAQSYARLTALIGDLWESTDWCRRIFEHDGQSLRLSTHEHEQMYLALARRDGEAAARLLRRQKSRSCSWLLEHVESKPPSPIVSRTQEET